jgi:putative SOS response-associated peptidase YedK
MALFSRDIWFAGRWLLADDTLYEWKVIAGDKQSYATARVDGQPMAFAGLWESFRGHTRR